MRIAVRVRRDFTVTGAGRLLAAARAAYLDLNPGATRMRPPRMVTSAAGAIFALLERDALIGRAADAALAAHAGHGLRPAGGRAHVTARGMHLLAPGPDCFERGDVFALPADPGRA